MAGEKYIDGSEGVLAIAVSSAWKPVGCLTSSSYNSTMEMVEKVTMCSGGKTERTPKQINSTVQIEGFVVDTTVVGGSGVDQSLKELRTLQKTQKTSVTPTNFRLSRGPLGYTYFKGYIQDVGDNFQAGEDATFSMTIQVEEELTADPLAGGS